VCKSSACAISKCNSGYADCDKSVKDGCEVVLASDINACGACGNVCKKPTNGSVACNAGQCETTCNAGYTACTGGCCVTPPALGTMDSGDRFNCAITSTGGVKCWGYNTNGKLGTGATSGSIQPTPASVTGLTNIVQVSTGREHACALSAGGGVMCWGSNYNDQLGTTGTMSATPVQVTGLTSGVRQVGAGHIFTCALMTTGGVKCWGTQALGNGTTAATSTPVDVTGITDAVMISTGYSHACALLSSGAVRCWGDVINPVATTPIDITSLGTNVKAIASGQANLVALMNDGTVQKGSTGYSTVTMAAVSGLSNVSFVTSDYEHSCAVSSGAAMCWGNNSYLQLGVTGTQTGVVTVTNLGSGVATIHAGDWHTCAVLTTGGIRCWGRADEGELGDGQTPTANEMVSTPATVLGF
jgi:alpha-tubulin suppressor-like RCC1 family protein